MKKLILFFSTALLLTSVGNAQQTERDSVSYSMALDFARQVVRVYGDDFVFEMAVKAMKDVVTDNVTWDYEDAMEYLRNYFMVRVPAKNAAKSEEYIQSVLRTNRKAVQTSSGLVFQILKKGSKKYPVDDRDKVTVHYVGKLPNGEIFDESKDEEGVQFQLNRVIKGWAEGMKLIGEGGRIALWIPADLAYGQYGRQPTIESNQALYFEVDLLEVEHYVEPEDDYLY